MLTFCWDSDVLRRYTEITPSVQMLGPTSFAPIINKAIEICAKEKAFHILIIVCDGQVTAEKPTREAIVRASSFPLSISIEWESESGRGMSERK